MDYKITKTKNDFVKIKSKDYFQANKTYSYEFNEYVIRTKDGACFTENWFNKYGGKIYKVIEFVHDSQPEPFITDYSKPSYGPTKPPITYALVYLKDTNENLYISDDLFDIVTETEEEKSKSDNFNPYERRNGYVPDVLKGRHKGFKKGDYVYVLSDEEWSKTFGKRLLPYALDWATKRIIPLSYSRNNTNIRLIKDIILIDGESFCLLNDDSLFGYSEFLLEKIDSSRLKGFNGDMVTIKKLDELNKLENRGIDEIKIYAEETHRIKYLEYNKRDKKIYYFLDNIFLTCPEETIVEKLITKKENKMKSIFEKIKNQYMPYRAENVRMTLDGNICIKVDDEYVAINSENELISYPNDFCLDFPFYIISKPISNIKIGDIIFSEGNYSKILEKKNANSFKCLSFKGTTQNKKTIKDFIFNETFVNVLINPFNGEDNNNLLMLMLMSDNNNVMNDDMLSKMMMFQMMQGNNNGFTNIQNNPFIMMSMFSDKGNDDMLSKMMMFQMMQGNNKTNLFGNINTASFPTMNIKTEKQCLEEEKENYEKKKKEELDNYKLALTNEFTQMFNNMVMGMKEDIKELLEKKRKSASTDDLVSQISCHREDIIESKNKLN